MKTDYNRIKVADLETNQPNKILKTNGDGELEFSDATDGGSQNLQQTLDNGSLWVAPDSSKFVSLFSDLAPDYVVIRAAGATEEDRGNSGNIDVSQDRVYMIATHSGKLGNIMIQEGEIQLSQVIQGTDSRVTQLRFRPPTAPGSSGAGDNSGALVYIPAPTESVEYNIPLKINGHQADNQGNVTIDLSNKQDISNQINVTLPATVLDTWHGKTVKFTGTGILTIPNTFVNSGMCFEGITKTGTSLSWSITAPKTFEFGTPLTVAEKQIFTFMQNEGQHSIMILGV